jgi:hypothetical protein
MERGVLVKAALDVLKSEDAAGKKALLAAVAVEIAARTAGFVDARIVGGRHRTWRALSSTKSLRKKEAK